MACFVGYNGLKANYILTLVGTKITCMKKIISMLVFILAGVVLFGQDVAGTWEGSFNAPDQMGGEVELTLVFHITKTDDGYSSTGDSPVQDEYGFETTSTSFVDKELVIKIDDIDFVYTGKLIDEKNVEGGFIQMGMEFDVNLVKRRNRASSIHLGVLFFAESESSGCGLKLTFVLHEDFRCDRGRSRPGWPTGCGECC
jgi:hypothetical protein